MLSSAAAETVAVNVRVAAGCGWKALSAASWITITEGKSGNGDGVVSFHVAENSTSTQRQGALVIADLLFEVTQAGQGCAYEVTPKSETFDASASSGEVTVTTADGCPWEAKSNNAWIIVTSGATGSGSGTVSYSVTAQDSNVERSGSLTVAGQDIAVEQSGAGCSFAIEPQNASYDANEGSGTLSVEAPAGCSWTATTNDSWITITSGSGQGDGTVEYSVAENTTIAVRDATISVGGETFDISQAGVACTDAISPTSASAGAAGKTGAVIVTATSGCSWTATTNDDWITITAGATGNGTGVVSYVADANPTSTTRTGEILIAGNLFVLTQAGLSCSFSVDPLTASVDSDAGNVSVSVSAPDGCDWTATSSESWIAVTSGSSGSGDGDVTLAISANSTSSTERSGSVTIAGRSFTVTQAGISCSYQLSSSSATHGSAADTGSVNVTAAAGCEWTASSDAAWVSVTGGASGSGNGMVSYSVQANSDASQRTATLTIAGQSFTVTQAGLACSYALSSSSASHSSAAGTGYVDVVAPNGCTWTASSNQAWLSITSGSSGSGNGAVDYSFGVNSALLSRTAMLTIAGQSFTLTQSGTCGDNIRSGSEQCDGADFGGLTCASFGYGEGQLQCSSCEIDTSDCCMKVSAAFTRANTAYVITNTGHYLTGTHSSSATTTPASLQGPFLLGIPSTHRKNIVAAWVVPGENECDYSNQHAGKLAVVTSTNAYCFVDIDDLTVSSSWLCGSLNVTSWPTNVAAAFIATNDVCKLTVMYRDDSTNVLMFTSYNYTDGAWSGVSDNAGNYGWSQDIVATFRNKASEKLMVLRGNGAKYDWYDYSQPFNISNWTKNQSTGWAACN